MAQGSGELQEAGVAGTEGRKGEREVAGQAADFSSRGGWNRPCRDFHRQGCGLPPSPTGSVPQHQMGELWPWGSRGLHTCLAWQSERGCSLRGPQALDRNPQGGKGRGVPGPG